MRFFSALLLLALSAAGCGPDREQPDPVPPPPALPEAPRSDTVDTAADADTSSAEWTAGIVEVERPRLMATLRAVRSAAHERFDRVVFEFDSGGVPGYHVSYIDEPVRQCGSGHVVPLAGEGWLEVRLSLANAHAEDGTPTVDDRSRSPALPVLHALTLTCDFEGVVTWVLGLAAPNRYRVIELSDPNRLVVDVRHG